MRRLICATCGERYPEGVMCLTPSGHSGPAEWMRVVKGNLRPLTNEQLTIRINGEPLPPLDDALCDLCNTTIKPNDEATTLYTWSGRCSDSAPMWESQYIDTGEE